MTMFLTFLFMNSFGCGTDVHTFLMVFFQLRAFGEFLFVFEEVGRKALEVD